jgi:transcriptional regulator with XRE-family HTH domain
VASPSPSKSDLLERGLALKGTQQDLAEAIGMDRSRLNHVIKGEDERLGVTNCLKLATVIDELPHVVLRAFDWTEEADILQKTYTTPPFTQKQIKVAELYGKATAKQKRLAMDLLTE